MIKFIQQRLRLFQIRRVKAFGESAVNLREHLTRFCRPPAQSIVLIVDAEKPTRCSVAC
jgi:hypothetical protein